MHTPLYPGIMKQTTFWRGEVLMCGRYCIESDTPDEKLTAIISMMDRKYPGKYKIGEIFPGDASPVLIERNGKITAVPAVFGFPGFRDGKLLINARSETAAEKRSFSESLKTRRVVIPATGFFEWSHDEKKTKYLFTLDSRRAVYLCGVYKIVDGQYRFVILTRAANESMAEIHNRMPIIAAEREVRPYLSDYESAMRIIAAEAPGLARELAEKKKAE